MRVIHASSPENDRSNNFVIGDSSNEVDFGSAIFRPTKAIEPMLLTATELSGRDVETLQKVIIKLTCPTAHLMEQLEEDNLETSYERDGKTVELRKPRARIKLVDRMAIQTVAASVSKANYQR